MKPMLFFLLILSLASCGEPPVREMAVSGKAAISRDPESYHMLSETSVTAARKINIAK